MANISRRTLLKGAGATLAATVVPKALACEVWIQGEVNPVVISAANGFTDLNGSTECCVARAYRLISSGSDVLDALIEGVNIVELDPTDASVGYGGLPNADGIVQLDSCCMHGPKKWAGGVAALEGVRTPSRVARAVMQNTDNHLLVGAGAQQFARNMGFTIEADLNTDLSHKMWLEWKRRIDPEHYLNPLKRDEEGRKSAMSMVRDGLINPLHYYGTINCNGINEKAEVCGVTTTSGLAFKIPGRAGDSPILGAGLYVDGDIGAAGSTGRGEANLFNCSSFLIVEGLRRGLHPKDAGMEALKRVASNTVEARLLDKDGHPNFGLQFYILDNKGRYAAVTMKGKNVPFAVCDDKGPRLEHCEVLFS
ncbi:MAG TPA: isoaspartyl peptidase/L-asparaginase [Fimbriimonadaceae bacterium]|jgi:N4-(beta-N-acetylglucosaminyl)-L-asparaginase